MEDKELVKTTEMYLKKRAFIHKAEELLLMDADRNDLQSIVYSLTLTCPKEDGTTELADEKITVLFKNGHRRRIDVTGNSNSANLKAILKVVY